MIELRHYTSFEDLKDSDVQTEPVLTKSAAIERDREYIEFIELARLSMEPSRPNQTSDAKQLH
jgi:hypothetical protein